MSNLSKRKKLTKKLKKIRKHMRNISNLTGITYDKLYVSTVRDNVSLCNTDTGQRVGLYTGNGV